LISKNIQLKPLSNNYRYCHDCGRKFIVLARIGKDGFLRCEHCHRDNKELNITDKFNI
jgi:predicted nucleic acid-binding Zn ribbon protein